MGWSLKIKIPIYRWVILKTPEFDEKQSSLTGNTEEGKNASDKTNDDDDGNVE